MDDAEPGDRRQQQAGDQHAFRFQGTNYLLLKGPCSRVMPLQVNGSYIAVGWGASSTGGGAVVWRDGSVFDLNDLIGDVLPHRLTDAVSINDRGQIVAWASVAA